MAHPRHDVDGYHFLHNAPVNFSWVDSPCFGHPLLPLWLHAIVENTSVFFPSLSAPSHVSFWFLSSSLLYPMPLFIFPAAYLLGSQFSVWNLPPCTVKNAAKHPASLCSASLILSSSTFSWSLIPCLRPFSSPLSCHWYTLIHLVIS